MRKKRTTRTVGSDGGDYDELLDLCSVSDSIAVVAVVGRWERRILPRCRCRFRCFLPLLLVECFGDPSVGFLRLLRSRPMRSIETMRTKTTSRSIYKINY